MLVDCEFVSWVEHRGYVVPDEVWHDLDDVWDAAERRYPCRSCGMYDAHVVAQHERMRGALEWLLGEVGLAEANAQVLKVADQPFDVQLRMRHYLEGVMLAEQLA